MNMLDLKDARTYRYLVKIRKISWTSYESKTAMFWSGRQNIALVYTTKGD